MTNVVTSMSAETLVGVPERRIALEAFCNSGTKVLVRTADQSWRRILLVNLSSLFHIYIFASGLQPPRARTEKISTCLSLMQWLSSAIII